jgi:hypothetical protein
MGGVVHGLREVVARLCTPLDWVSPLVGLTLFSIASGALMLWVVGKTTPQRWLRRSRDQMIASVYEVRLYLDSPRRMLAAQGRLLVFSMAYTACLLPAFVALGPPLLLLYAPLELRYGVAPLATGEPALVKVTLAPGAPGEALRAEAATAGLRVTAPPVLVEDERRAYLRLAVDQPGDHRLTLRLHDRTWDKQVSAGADALPSPERASGLAALISLGTEPPLDAEDGIEGIEIAHEARVGSWLGLDMPWWLYWLGVATIAALALRRPLGVVL